MKNMGCQLKKDETSKRKKEIKIKKNLKKTLRERKKERKKERKTERKTDRNIVVLNCKQ